MGRKRRKFRISRATAKRLLSNKKLIMGIATGNTALILAGVKTELKAAAERKQLKEKLLQRHAPVRQITQEAENARKVAKAIAARAAEEDPTYTN